MSRSKRSEISDSEWEERPIQLIKYNKNGKFEVDKECENYLEKVDYNFGFCAIAGKYRTGKSFIMNKLLQT